MERDLTTWRSVAILALVACAAEAACGGSVVSAEGDGDAGAAAAGLACSGDAAPTCVSSCAASESVFVPCTNGSFSCPAGMFGVSRCPSDAFDSLCGPPPDRLKSMCGCTCGADRLYVCQECPDAAAPVDAPVEAAPEDASVDVEGLPDAEPGDASQPRPAALVELGNFVSCALVVDGSLWCWGFTGLGQLGYVPGSDAVTHPVRMSGLPTVAAVDLGRGHTCAVDVNGAVWCWGLNSHGQVGDGNVEPDGPGIPFPLQVPISDVVSVGCGDLHSCGVHQDGSVACWGWNSDGQTGQTAASPDFITAPKIVPGLTDVIEVGLGNLHTCARRANGSVWCWGTLFGPAYGQPPTPVSGIDSAVQLSVGRGHNCIVDEQTDVWCWGAGSKGQLGQGTTDDSLVPVHVLSGATFVRAGLESTCAVLVDGTTRCWGYGQGLQSADFTAPTDVLGVAGVASVGLSGEHGCILQEDQLIRCWGLNFYGQCGNGTNQIYAPLGPVVW